MALSVLQTLQGKRVRSYMGDELKRIWKEMVIA
jgi:hypothetical protein